MIIEYVGHEFYWLEAVKITKQQGIGQFNLFYTGKGIDLWRQCSLPVTDWVHEPGAVSPFLRVAIPTAFPGSTPVLSSPDPDPNPNPKDCGV